MWLFCCVQSNLSICVHPYLCLIAWTQRTIQALNEMVSPVTVPTESLKWSGKQCNTWYLCMIRQSNKKTTQCFRAQNMKNMHYVKAHDITELLNICVNHTSTAIWIILFVLCQMFQPLLLYGLWYTTGEIARLKNCWFPWCSQYSNLWKQKPLENSVEQ